MSNAMTTSEDHDQHIFEGLDRLSAPDIDLPAMWADSFDEDDLEIGVAARELPNARIDMEVECWGRRLA